MIRFAQREDFTGACIFSSSKILGPDSLLTAPQMEIWGNPRLVAGKQNQATNHIVCYIQDTAPTPKVTHFEQEHALLKPWMTNACFMYK